MYENLRCLQTSGLLIQNYGLGIHSDKIWADSTVKLGDKERFDKVQIGVKEPFPVTKCQFTHNDKELSALRNNFRVTKKFLITKFDCITNVNVRESGVYDFFYRHCKMMHVMESKIQYHIPSSYRVRHGKLFF